MSLTKAFKDKCKKYIKETSVTAESKGGRGGQCVQKTFFGVSKVTLTTSEIKKISGGTFSTSSEDVTYSIGDGAYKKKCAKLDNWVKSTPAA